MTIRRRADSTARSIQGKIGLPSPVAASAVFLCLALVSVPAAADVCIDCHRQTGLTGAGVGGRTVSVRVDPDSFAVSAHGSLGCRSCHADAAARAGKTTAPVRCSGCHGEEPSQLAASAHGPYFESAKGGRSACLKCHDYHYERPSDVPGSRLAKPANVHICLDCHSDETRFPADRRDAAGLIRAYRNSVHGTALLDRGRGDAPGCVECHGAHDVRPVDAPVSRVYKPNIPGLCGGCHGQEASDYRGGIHGTALAEGILEAPSCADCHGEHTISPPTDPKSAVAPRNVSATCAHCHGAEALVDRFGLSRAVVRTYEGSFHGITNRFGRAEAANCASCHGYHDIRPSSDPESNIHPTNLPGTCGRCHPNAGVNFARGRVHVEARPESSVGVYLVRQFYTWLIILFAVGFLIHMFLQTWSAIRQRRGSKGD